MLIFSPFKEKKEIFALNHLSRIFDKKNYLTKLKLLKIMYNLHTNVFNNSVVTNTHTWFTVIVIGPA